MARSTRSRQRLIEAAERLFSQRGIDAVSLAEITTEAQLNNTGAVHYYFGGRDELLDAIADEHRVEIDRRRDELLDVLEATGDTTTESLARALIQPLVDQLDDPRGRAFLSIQAQRHLRPRPTGAPASRRPLALRVLGLREAGSATGSVASLLNELALLLTYGALAQRARLEAGEPGRGDALDRDTFVDHLVGAVVRVYATDAPPRGRRAHGPSNTAK